MGPPGVGAARVPRPALALGRLLVAAGARVAEFAESDGITDANWFAITRARLTSARVQARSSRR